MREKEGAFRFLYDNMSASFSSDPLTRGFAYITISNSPKSMNLICWVQLMERYLILALACKLELQPLLESKATWNRYELILFNSYCRNTDPWN
jgi:hypothetical protein